VSRIGKLPIPVPQGVAITIEPTRVSVKGPKGTLAVDTHGRVDVQNEDGQIVVRRFDDSRQAKAYHGLYQRLISNCVTGVTAGFRKELEIQGVGYRAQVQGSELILNVGYSNPVSFPAPDGIKLSAPTQTEVAVEGIDKQLVGETAARIRGVRPPEPYKGKGIRYKGEYIRRKVGKASGK